MAKQKKEANTVAKQKKSVKKYFEAYMPEDSHVPTKTDEDGYHAAISFNDADNRLTGPLRIKEIDPVEESKKIDLMIAQFQSERAAYEYKQRQQRHEDFIQGAEAINDIAQNLIELIPYAIRFGAWCRYTAYPTIKDHTIPWVKRKVSRITRRQDHDSEVLAKAVDQPTAEEFYLGQITPEFFLETASKAHYNYKLNASSEEAREHFLNIVFLASALANEIRFFSSHTVVPDNMRLDEAQQKKWRVALEEFATEKVAESINDILQSDPPMLMEPSVISSFQAIGGKVSEDKILLPIHYQDFKEALNISEDIQ